MCNYVCIFFDTYILAQVVHRRSHRILFFVVSRSASCAAMSEIPTPLAITIVSGSKQDGAWFKSQVCINGQEAEWDFIDLDVELVKDNDPSTTIGFGMDHTNEVAVRCVLEQDDFPTVVTQQVFKACAAGRQKQFLFCNTQCNAAVTSATMESHMNSMCWSVDDRGAHRMCNAKWFPLHTCWNPDSYKPRSRTS
jgi:hypothetical protein